MALVEVLEALRASTFDPRTLKMHLPLSVMRLASPEVAEFFRRIPQEGEPLTDDAIISDRWRDDEAPLSYYHTLGEDHRLEVHAIICAALHELSHKVDLLISPCGVQYLEMQIEQYRLLQQYIPQALDIEHRLEALRLRHKLDDGPGPEIRSDPLLSELWPVLSGLIHRLLAWGDLADRRPMAHHIDLGWPGYDRTTADFFGIGLDLELILVSNQALSFRPANAKSWFLRPMTLFEAKALSNAMLYIMEISSVNGARDVNRYFHALYGDRDDLRPDYFFILDIVAKIYGQKDFSSVLGAEHADLTRSVLIVTSGLCWFGLHAWPTEPDADTGSLASDPAFRIFFALAHLAQRIARRQPMPSSMQALCDSMEEDPFFAIFGLSSAAASIADTSARISALKTIVAKEVWHPDARDWFLTLLKMAEPHFEGRDPTYGSLMGMPSHGNPRRAVRRDEDMELCYNDHSPPDGIQEWLALRDRLIFNYLEPLTLSHPFVTELDAHFMAGLVRFDCAACGHDHWQWMSRHMETRRLICPVTGTQLDLTNEEFEEVWIATSDPPND